MGRASLVPLLVLVLLLPARARAGGCLVDVDGLVAFPFGTLAGGRRTADQMDTGYGVRAELLYQIEGHLAAGLAVSGLSFTTHVENGTLLADANLTALPVYALARLHTLRGAGFGTYAEAGLGITAWNRDPIGAGSATSTQTTFSYDVGAGASFQLSRRWDLRAGAQYQQAVTGRGEVWARGDDPKLVVVHLGTRFQY